MNPRIEIHRDRQSLADALARLVADAAARAISARRRFAIALAGGSTPKDAYERLAQPPWRMRIDWAKVDVFFGDERCVPPQHADSNYRMAREALLTHVPLDPKRIFRMEAERSDLGRSARDYAERLRSTLGAAPNAVPQLDLVLLGIGEDGHTASIFPDVVELVEGPELVARVYSNAKQSWRMTLTLPVLNAAREVVFAAAGAGKRDVIARILDQLRGGDTGLPLPAAMVRPESGQLAFLLDREAAGDPGERTKQP